MSRGEGLLGVWVDRHRGEGGGGWVGALWRPLDTPAPSARRWVSSRGLSTCMSPPVMGGRNGWKNYNGGRRLGGET